MKIRIKFSKLGPIKFIGHLDFMRTMQKVFRRSDIDIAYSEGFNPHQLFSIAAPLSVGVESNAEYLDLKLASDADVKETLKAIDDVCPNGVKIIGGVHIGDKETAAMALVALAKYTITQKDLTITPELINKFMAQDEIIIQKKTKKGRMKALDIKPGIMNFNTIDDTIIMSTSTGSTLNVKPLVVLETLCQQNDIEYNRYNYSLLREEIYHGSGHDYKPLTIPKTDNGCEFIEL